MPASTSEQTKRLTALLSLFVILIAFGAIVVAKSREGSSLASNAQAAYESISLADYAKDIIDDQDVLTLDVRSKSDFVVEHIPDAVSIPSYELPSRVDELQPFMDWKIVVVCSTSDCPEFESVSRTLHLNGYQSVFLLDGGFEAYKAAELSTSSQAKLVQDDLVALLKNISVPEMTDEQLQAKLGDDNLVLVDSRTSYEFATGFIKGAVNIPINQFSEAMQKGLLPKDKLIVVYDRVGNRAKIGVQALLDQGYANVFNLTGGFELWQKGDGPVDILKPDGSDIPDKIPVLNTQL